MSRSTTVGAYAFLDTVRANVDNERLSDTAFREYIRNTLPIICPSLSDDPEYRRAVDEAVGLSQRVERLQQAVDNLA